MSLDNFWLYIILAACGAALLRIGVTGQVRSIGRGSARGVTATVRSIPLRVGFVVLGTMLLVGLILKAFGRIYL